MDHVVEQELEESSGACHGGVVAKRQQQAHDRLQAEQGTAGPVQVGDGIILERQLLLQAKFFCHLTLYNSASSAEGVYKHLA